MSPPRIMLGLVAAAAAILVVLAVTGRIGEAPFADILSMSDSADQIASKIREWGAWSFLGSVLLMVAHSFLPIPAELVAVANGIVFGLIVGSVLTWIGAMLGAALAFGLARAFGRGLVIAVLPPKHAAALDRWSTAIPLPLILLLVRFIPVVSFNLINYAAGLTLVSWWTFLWTTGLGIAPLTLAMVYVGDQMESGRWEIALIVGAASLALTAGAYLISKRIREPRSSG